MDALSETVFELLKRKWLCAWEGFTLCNRGGVVFAFRIVEELYQGAAAALRVCEAVLIVLTWLIRRSFTSRGRMSRFIHGVCV